MSDFFTRLAERTLGLALIIQPIKPSLFAPERDSDDETLLEIDEECETAQAFSDTAISDRPTQTRSEETITVQNEQVRMEQSSPAVTPARQSPDALSTNGIYPRHNAALGENASPQRSRSAMKPRSPDAVSARGLTAVVPFSTASQAYQEVSDASVSFSRVEQAHIDDFSRSSAIAESGSSLDDGNAMERFAESTAPFEQKTTRHVFLGERGIRSPQLPARKDVMHRSLQEAWPEAPTTEPSIQVTIGRVEVRAAPSPVGADLSRPPARPTTSHPMSLDEYLRRQEQGGRR